MARAGWRWWPSAVRYAVLGLGLLVGLVGIVLLIWRVPPALYAYVPDPKDRAAAEASTRTGLIAGLAGLGALGSLAIASRTYRLTQQGQITDRYTRAIEQLGSDKLDVRLGGIYALERIATDSERDHSTVVEVLSAFIREHSQPGEVRQPVPDCSSDNEPNESSVSHKPRTPVRPLTDAQAAFTVLGRLPLRSGVPRGDLSGALLAGAQLDVGANLAGARLIRTNLAGARLIRTNLAGAQLGGADLSGAQLMRASLFDAVLFGADLAGARLDYQAILSGARLNGANLSGAQLNGAVGLTQGQLESAHGDASTVIPVGLRRPDHWPAGEKPPPVSS